MPYSARFTGCSIGDINGPGIGASLKQGHTLFEAVVADERDLLAVRRPPRHGVAIHRRSKVADGFSAEIVDADEAVVPAMGNEGDLRTIGRPLGRIILPAHEGKLMRRHRAGHRRSPELPARGPNCRGAIGGDLDVFTSFPRAIQFAQQARLPLVHVHGPHLLVWARNIARRIRNLAR